MSNFGTAVNTISGTERAGDLVMWAIKTLGAAIVGKVAGFDSYEIAGDNGTKRTVKFVKLVDAVEFQPDSEHSTTGKSVEHLAIGVSLNADTKNKLDEATLPIGTCILIQFREIAPELQNMRRFRVEVLTKQQYADLIRARSQD
jgi:hypothetical protein